MGRSRKGKRGTQRWGERAQFPGDPEHEDTVITMMCRNPLSCLEALRSTEMLADGLLNQIYFRDSEGVNLWKNHNYWKQPVWGAAIKVHL